MKRTLFALILTAVLAPLGAQAETLTIDQCVAIALKENPEVAGANYEVEAAVAKKNVARGGYSPRLKLDAGVQRWDSTFAVPLFGGIYQYCTNCTWSQVKGPDGNSVIGKDGNPQLDVLSPLTLRPQWTWSAGVTLAQPIGALWTVHEANVLTKLGVDVAEIKRKSTRRDVAFQVTEAYYRLLQAKAMAAVAEKSVEQVTAQVKRAHTFFERGAVAKNDVLRAELGLASAQQRLIQANGLVSLARGRLATIMGRSPDMEIDAVDVSGEPTVLPLVPVGQAEQQAVDTRFELKEIAAHIDQAGAGVRMAKSKMVPQVNAVANYTRQTSSLLGLPKSWFIGATASWDIWEGGSTYYGIDESRAQLAQAIEARRKAEDMIRLDARNAHVGVTTSAEALDVAKHAVEQAEENFRIEQKRYESTSNTSFDVLDAETQLTTARGQHQAALYDLILAQSNLDRATGNIVKAAQ
ncbi:MAG TPA: TolC family protein [Polyangia bacterium]|jgi:outer membrane protein TolC